MKIAHVSTFRTSCGVAIYLEELCNALAKHIEQKVFAETTDKELPPLNPSIDIQYERVYIRGGSYETCLQKIIEYKPNIVHIQFESSMYQELYQPNSPFTQFVHNIQTNGLKVIVTLHNVLPKPNFESNETKFISEWYKNLNCAFIAGNEPTKNELLKWHATAEAYTFVLGSPIFNPMKHIEAAAELDQDSNAIYIVQPGFYGADKGMIQLVQMLPQLLSKYPNLKLVFAGGLHPQAPEAWRVHTRDCIKEIVQRRLTKNVIMLGRYVPEEELNQWLGLSDVIMLNYHWVSGLYSASASGKRVLCANRPIIMNSQDVRLSEFINDVHCCKTDDAHLAYEISHCIENKEYAQKISAGAVTYAHETSFDKIAEKHLKLYGVKQ